MINCELPAPPPPPPPTLVVAYTDANLNHIYDTGDVMIAEIVDTDGSGTVSVNDTINMGQYPTRLDATTPAPARIRQTTEPWRVRSHTITAVNPGGIDEVSVASGANFFEFFRTGAGSYDEFNENGPGGNSSIYDRPGNGDPDGLVLVTGSPSQPLENLNVTENGTDDAHFIDVDFLTP